MENKINEDCLIILKPKPYTKYIEFEFFKIEKVLERELYMFEYDLNSNIPRKEIIRKNKGLRYLLEFFDYGETIANSYQGTPDYTGFKGGRYLLTTSIETLVEFVKKRINAFRIEKTYSIVEKLIDQGKAYAYSHRKVGWTAKPFQINNEFQIQFNTNFGYGYVSYFYLKIEYKNITIIPYSDWIVYRNANIFEIQRYTRKYQVKDDSWLQAMEDCKTLFNLAISNENQFIEKYIIQEAKKMVEGLKKILQYNEFKLFNLNKDEITLKLDGFKIIEYRAEKISGALQFISHLINFKSNEEISNLINEIQTINKEILPILKRELELITNRLNEIEPKLLRLEPIVESLRERANIILKKHNEINDRLHEKYKSNYGKKDRKNEIDKLLTQAFPNWKAESDEYFEVHNKKYNPLKQEFKKLEPVKVSINKYLKEIEDYFKQNP